MVFGNQLIDFAANGIKNVKLTPISDIPTKVDVGLSPKESQKIEEQLGEWIFTLNLDGGSWRGCGPNDSEGNPVGWGVCVSYSATEYTEREIRRKLTDLMKQGMKTVDAQEEYERQLQEWEWHKNECGNKVKEGSTFQWVNRDENNAPDIGPIDDDWYCLETILPIENEVEGEATPDEEEDEEDDEVSATTVPVVSSQSKNTVSIGFGSGFKDILNKGLLGIGILVIGYGAYKVEERSSLFSKLFKKIVPKKEASFEGKKNEPKKA
jgi:hypothetical protein